jgi:hypothetical protein
MGLADYLILKECSLQAAIDQILTETDILYQRKFVNTMEIPEVLEAFKINDGIYKREYVEAAVQHKDEIIPHLIGILDKVLSDPALYLENDYFDHLYAVILLGHFGAHQAHKTIIDVFSMPGESLYEIFGDTITEDLPAILFKTCGGSLDEIRALALNKDAYVYCRSSALKAMVYAVVDGMVSREEVLEFFGSLFTGNEAEPDSDFWSFAAGCIRDLYPEELMPVIEKAYQDEMIDPWFIAPRDFEKALERGKEYAFGQVRKNMERRMPADVHKLMSWWACFKSEEQYAVPLDSVPSTAPSVVPPVILTKKEKRDRKKKKKKRKMAKASRRKNRR